jgi:hypothetical protein
MTRAKAIVVTLLILGAYLLHQDFWNWKRAEPLIFGFLPIGLAYHAAYSVLAALLMATLVKVAWPKHLENIEAKPGEGSRQDKDKDSA